MQFNATVSRNYICELQNLWKAIFLKFIGVLFNAMNISRCIKFEINFNRPDLSFTQPPFYS